MHLHDGAFESAQRVREHHAGVSQAARVDDDGRSLAVLLLDEVDERALVVAQLPAQLDAERVGLTTQAIVDLGKGDAAVDLRLAAPDGAEVGTVEDKDPHAASASESALRTASGCTTMPATGSPRARNSTQRATPARAFLSTPSCSAMSAAATRGRWASPQASSSSS